MNITSPGSSKTCHSFVTVHEDVEQEEPIDEFVCPISQGRFENPVVITKCQHVFEETDILGWLEKEGTCPIDRGHVGPGDIQPAYKFKEAVVQFGEYQTRVEDEKKAAENNKKFLENRARLLSAQNAILVANVSARCLSSHELPGEEKETEYGLRAWDEEESENSLTLSECQDRIGVGINALMPRLFEGEINNLISAELETLVVAARPTQINNFIKEYIASSPNNISQIEQNWEKAYLPLGIYARDKVETQIQAVKDSILNKEQLDQVQKELKGKIENLQKKLAQEYERHTKTKEKLKDASIQLEEVNTKMEGLDEQTQDLVKKYNLQLQRQQVLQKKIREYQILLAGSGIGIAGGTIALLVWYKKRHS